MDKQKIVFMDCDGVLNYTQWYFSDRNPGNLYGQEGDIDPECVARILKVCEVTGAKIVLSSDWRIDKGAIPRLERAGFPKGLICDQTPELIWTHLNYYNTDTDSYDYSRGKEIDLWLDAHQDTYDYVIIDDREDFTDEQKRLHFVHVDSDIGFTDENMNKAIEILTR